MDQLVHCAKCQSVPYDVLMMNCNHNLCVKCALTRIQSQHVAKSVTGRMYIQCEKCKARTNLDDQSVTQLERAKKTNNAQLQYIDKDANKRVQTPINTGRLPKKTIKTQQPQHKLQSAKTLSNLQHTPVTHQSPTKTAESTKKQYNNDIVKQQKKETKKQVKKQKDYGECQVHKEEPVMYYCFTCKIHCFCAECVLLGKHNQHDVKIIKKAYAAIEQQFKDAIQSTKKFISELIDKNRSVASDINASKNKADAIKKTIEKGFDEVRHIIRQKELQFMKMVDKQFTKMMETNHGLIKNAIDSKLKEQQTFLLKLEHTAQIGEGAVLNMYADQRQKILQFLKNQTIKLPTAQSKLDEALTSYLTQAKQQMEKIQVKEVD